MPQSPLNIPDGVMPVELLKAQGEVAATTAAPINAVQVAGNDGTNIRPLYVAAPADGLAPSYLQGVIALVWNGSGFDRVRGVVVNKTFLASAARTADTYGTPTPTWNARRAHLVLRITAAPDTAETLTLVVYPATSSTDSGTGNIGSIVSPAGSAIQSGAPITLIVGDAATAVLTANYTACVGCPLPYYLGAGVQPSGASSWTYSLELYLLP